MPARGFWVASICLVALFAGGVLMAGKDEKKKPEFPWLPFATNSQGQSSWLMFTMPPPVEFQNYGDCKARIAQFISTNDRKNPEFKAPYGCTYHGNNFLYVYAANWLHDGGSLAGCLAKHIVSTTDDDSVPLYDTAILAPGQAEAGPTWYCVAKWPGFEKVRQAQRNRQVDACQRRDTSWKDFVNQYELPSSVAAFNKQCAELGIKTDCKVVSGRDIAAPPGESQDDRWLRENFPTATCAQGR